MGPTLPSVQVWWVAARGFHAKACVCISEKKKPSLVKHLQGMATLYLITKSATPFSLLVNVIGRKSVELTSRSDGISPNSEIQCEADCEGYWGG